MFLGDSGLTMARYGCITTAITSGYDSLFNSFTSPAQCVQKLEYTDGGLLIWESLKNINLKLIKRIQGRNDVEMQKALSANGQFCVIQVNNNHWLLLIGRKLPLLGYKVFDPLYGDFCYTKRYRNNISGCAIIGII
jgi:hypothetical protein